MEMIVAEWWQAAVVAALGGGGGVGILGMARDLAKSKREQAVSVTTGGGDLRDAREDLYTERSMTALMRTLEELQDENARLRATQAQREAEHEAERARLRAEIDRLYEQIQRERTEAAQRYDALLERVHRLQRRMNPPTPPAGTATEEGK